MNQLGLFDAPQDAQPATPRFRCNIGRCAGPAVTDSIYCEQHERNRPAWPFPRWECRAWACTESGEPIGNGGFCREHQQLRKEWLT